MSKAADEIPEDVRKKVHNVVNGLPAGDNRQLIEETIARAILSERKRCAEIARIYKSEVIAAMIESDQA